jgi:hypothetical protein
MRSLLEYTFRLLVITVLMCNMLFNDDATTSEVTWRRLKEG